MVILNTETGNNEPQAMSFVQAWLDGKTINSSNFSVL
jgi:hypothetical protein